MNLKQLSEKLQLSQTTVSRALNGYPEVKEATRLRVNEAARQYGYQPNLRARTLATGRSMSIGHIIPASRQNELGNIIFSDFIAGAGAVYADHGYSLTLSIVQDDQERSAYQRIAERGAVDGVIVQSPSSDDPRIAYLAELGIPFLVHGRASQIQQMYGWLDVNNKSAMQRATAHLLDLGHRRIALVNGEERMDFAARRRAGYVTALQAARVPIDTAIMCAGEMSEPNGYAKACAFLSQDKPPTAFVASSIILAIGIERALAERGLRAGKDVSIVCFDDDISYLPNHGTPPRFTCVKSSVRAAGARCAELLLEQVRTPGTPLPNELWEAELIVGVSSGPAKEV